MKILIGLLVPFLGTVFGSVMVFLLKDKMSEKLEKILLGFASGVMIAASIWSLLNPAIEMAEEQGVIPYLPAAIGFMVGILFLLLLDVIIPHLHVNSDKPEGINLNNNKTNLKKKTMMVFAVTLHNIPEGMAVGVILAGAMSGSGITFASALALAIGIAIQNFPEGAIVSMGLAVEGKNKSKAFITGALSGVVEPIAGVITILLANIMVPILPYLLSFAAGAMIYCVCDELIPESQNGKHSHMAIIGLAVGFVLMMVLDIALG